jgi:hypothetical protein
MQRVIMRARYTKECTDEQEITMDTYRSHLDTFRSSFERVCEWEGEDRDGRPLRVAWVPDPCMRMATFYWYEIQEA